MKKYADKFLEKLKIELNYSELTIEGYRQEIEKFNFFIQKNNINYKKLTNDNIRFYLKHLDNLKYSKNSIGRNLSALRTFYKYLSEEQVINFNPFKNISNPKKNKKLPNFLNYEEINKIFESIETDSILKIRNKCIIELLYDTGIRVSELVNIKIQDIDFEEKTIHIFGKGKKQRIVYFGSFLTNILDMYLNKSRNYLLNGKDNNYLILNNRGDKITTRGIELIVDNIVEKSAIKHKISPHVLRHTFASHMLNNGADIKTIQQLLGHESLSTTGIYTHITSDVLRSEYLKNHPRK